MPVLIWDGIESLATVVGLGAGAKALDTTNKQPLSGVEIALIAFAVYYFATKGLK